MNLPRTLPRRVWAPLLVLLLVSGVVSSMLGAEPPLVQTRTSHGGIPAAWGAAFDLLQELGLRPERTRAPWPVRPAAQAQWIIDPAWHARELPHQLAALEEFAGRGGSVVLVGAGGDVLEGLGFGAGLRESDPGIEADLADAGVEPEDAVDAGTPARARAPALSGELTPRLMHGPWLRRPRRVEVAAHRLFASDALRADEVRVRSSAGVLAFERQLGRGKIVALADAAFLTNERLGNHDNAAFLVDLVQAFGQPVFDERCHGLLPERSPWSALGGGFVLLAALSLSALGLSVVQYARRWPALRAPERALPPPSLELFVGSLAALYRARGRSEPAAVFRAYRAGFLRRLARGVSGARERAAPGDEQRLAQQARRLGVDARWLSEEAVPASPLELATAVAALERYAAAVHGEGKR
jgi:hypothetical protein